MEEAIYVISTLEHSKKNEYKLGYHTGVKKKLISRYTTSLINPIIHYFRYSKYAKEIEAKLKQHFEKERIINNNGNKTEWINIQLDILIIEIDKIFSKYEKNNYNKYKQINNNQYFDYHSNNILYYPNKLHESIKTEQNVFSQEELHALQDSQNNFRCNKYPYVEYKCNRCKKVFYKKCRYTDHLNRKFLCPLIMNENSIKNNINNKNYCEICNRYYSRPDILERHKKSKTHLLYVDNHVTNNNAQTTNGNITQITDNKKVIINNYNFIYPFNKEEIDNFMSKENLTTFAPKQNDVKLKEGYTMNNVIKEMNEKKEYSEKIKLNKKLALYLLYNLNQLNKYEKNYFDDIINKTNDFFTINIIINVLNHAFCIGYKIDDNAIQNKIKKEMDIENFLLNKL